MAAGDIWLSEQAINKAFRSPWHPDDPDKTPDQSVPFFRIWRMVFPDWDRIERIDRWPAVNKKTWKYIQERFIAFDKVYHPRVFAGGLWMNSGFTVNDELEDWYVDKSVCTVHYKEDEHWTQSQKH